MSSRRLPARLRSARAAVTLMAAAVLTITGCGGSPTSDEPATSQASGTEGDHPWDGLTGDEREQALIEAAKDEGTLSVYSGYNDEQAMADAFTKKYDIPVEVYNANSETVLQRILQEAEAGEPRNDVLSLPSPDIQAAESEGLLADYDSEYRDRISDKGKGDQWTAVRRLAFVAGWNTEALDTDELPEDYSGFADPSWKGRLSMELSDIDWYATLKAYYVDSGMSDDEVTSMFQAIAANSKVAKGHTVQGQLLAAGQFDVALSLYSQTVERLQQDSAPATYGAEEDHVVEPVVVRYDAGGLMEGGGNVAAATLYLDFQLSDDGFDVDEELGALPPIPQADEPLADAETVELDTGTFVDNRTEISAEYEELLRESTHVG